MTTLTKEMVMRKAKVYNIETITQLHLFNQMINNIDIIKGMKSLESITLSRNQIKSLKAFEGLKNLSVLSLQDNLISDFTELMHLRNCINLRKLWLGQNPISSNPVYRLIVIRYLPFLNFLDEKEISDEEREGAHNLDEYAIKNNNHFNHNHFNYNYVKNKNPYKKDFVREKKKEIYDYNIYSGRNVYNNRNFYFGESENEYAENCYQERYNTPQRQNTSVLNSISYLLKDMNRDELEFILNEINKKISMY